MTKEVAIATRNKKNFFVTTFSIQNTKEKKNNLNVGSVAYTRTSNF